MSDRRVGDAQPVLLSECRCQGAMSCSENVSVGTCRRDEDGEHSIMLASGTALLYWSMDLRLSLKRGGLEAEGKNPSHKGNSDVWDVLYFVAWLTKSHKLRLGREFP